MDELDAFERQVADELGLMAGGTTFVDPTAMADEIAAAMPRREGERDRRRMALAIAGALLGVALIAAGAIVLVGGSADAPSSAPVSTLAPVTSPEPSAPASLDPAAARTPPAVVPSASPGG